MDYKLALKTAADNWTNPTWWWESALPFAKRTALSGTLKPYYRVFGPESDNFMAEDWDNLLILDACRYDMFEEVCSIDGELERRTSVGSSTPEFLKNTFRGKSFQDTVYVTANPQVALRLDSSIFHDVIDVWKSDWDEDLETVRPDPVTKAALEAQEEYPEKRLLVHYMQPHYPFIGEVSQDKLDDHSGFELTKRLASDEKANRDSQTVWDQLKNGELSEDVVWDAYLENLELVLDNLEESIDEFTGKTVITSDHGNLIGETTTPFNIELYGHPTGVHTKNLVTVPWLALEDSTRKEITYEESATESDPEPSEAEEEIINERLQHLGYK
jgi:hypothetical protein